MTEPLRVDFDRLQADVETLAGIGRAADHGIYRMAFSPGDMAARQWLRERIEAAGLSFYEDGAANLVNADLNEEGANMLMLQTRQSLGTTSLSLASQAAQSVMRLF